MELINLNLSHTDKLFEIVSDSSTMHWLGDGNTWSKEKLTSLIYSTTLDREQLKSPRKLFYWATINNCIPIGLIGIQPYDIDSGESFYVTSLLHPNQVGKGYGVNALNMALKKFQELRPDIKEIYIDTLTNNVRAQKTLNNFRLIGIIKIHNRYHLRYVLLF